MDVQRIHWRCQLRLGGAFVTRGKAGHREKEVIWGFVVAVANIEGTDQQPITQESIEQAGTSWLFSTPVAKNIQHAELKLEASNAAQPHSAKCCWRKLQWAWWAACHSAVGSRRSRRWMVTVSHRSMKCRFLMIILTDFWENISKQRWPTSEWSCTFRLSFHFSLPTLKKKKRFSMCHPLMYPSGFVPCAGNEASHSKRRREEAQIFYAARFYPQSHSRMYIDCNTEEAPRLGQRHCEGDQEVV